MSSGGGLNQYDPFSPHARAQHAGAPIAGDTFTVYGGCSRWGGGGGGCDEKAVCVCVIVIWFGVCDCESTYMYVCVRVCVYV